ncbi:MAG: xanthine dehydrogenase family protein molybdopterin-binding subunit [Spirochaetaceae bacterium]|jgi:CO/xanthine dehydrogenase Mo-binding subunit|nr:xanthine dehydrogenase family protein molybdopterin-binding subunit [Spirochaetaceae bacterium]
MMLLDDISVAGMFHAALLRSPAAKGKIKKIEMPQLRNIDIILPAAIPGANRFLGGNMPLLAENEVSYIGQPLAIVVAPSEREAEIFIHECSVAIDEEPPAYSIETFTKDNVFEEYRFQDTALFTGTGCTTVGNTYQTGIQYHWPNETCGVFAEYHENGLVINVAAEDTGVVQAAVASALGKETADVKINALPAGIHFGLKTVYPAQIACYAALAAHSCRQSVRLLLTRDEEFLYCPKRARSRFCISSDIDKNGVVQKTKIDARYDYGAWNFWEGSNTPEGGGALKAVFTALRQVYNLGEIEESGIAVRTNLPPAGPFCGGGISHGVFVLENHISNIADSLNINGIDWRKERLSKASSAFSPSNKNLLAALLDKAGELSGYKRKRSAYKALGNCPEDEIIPRRGIGIALVSLEAALPAVAVIEAEIDKVGYTPLMRGLWLIIAVPVSEKRRPIQSPAPRHPSKRPQKAMRRAVLQGTNAALGWASSEKIEYLNGRLVPDISSDYRILKPSEMPAVHIEFTEYTPAEGEPKPEEEVLLDLLRQTPFHIVPSAFLQAISQAAQHEFVKIPLSAANIWNFLRKQPAWSAL